MGMIVVGVEEKSRGGTVLKNELQKIGFRLSELEFADAVPEEECFCLVLGSPALRQVAPGFRMSEVSGQVLITPHCAVVVPNYAPGFLYHNPNMKGLWVENLKLAYVAYQLETKGVIA